MAAIVRVADAEPAPAAGVLATPLPLTPPALPAPAQVLAPSSGFVCEMTRPLGLLTVTESTLRPAAPLLVEAAEGAAAAAVMGAAGGDELLAAADVVVALLDGGFGRVGGSSGKSFSSTDAKTDLVVGAGRGMDGSGGPPPDAASFGETGLSVGEPPFGEVTGASMVDAPPFGDCPLGEPPNGEIEGGDVAFGELPLELPLELPRGAAIGGAPIGDLSGGEERGMGARADVGLARSAPGSKPLTRPSSDDLPRGEVDEHDEEKDDEHGESGESGPPPPGERAARPLAVAARPVPPLRAGEAPTLERAAGRIFGGLDGRSSAAAGEGNGGAGTGTGAARSGAVGAAIIGCEIVVACWLLGDSLATGAAAAGRSCSAGFCFVASDFFDFRGTAESSSSDEQLWRSSAVHLLAASSKSRVWWRAGAGAGAGADAAGAGVSSSLLNPSAASSSRSSSSSMLCHVFRRAPSTDRSPPWAGRYTMGSSAQASAEPERCPPGDRWSSSQERGVYSPVAPVE